MVEKPKPPRPLETLRHVDGRCRCPWPGQDGLYIAYHDNEWGTPERDDSALFEKLVLDGFQAGLAWITILRKRDAFRAAFDGFVPARIARYDAARVETLMQDAGIVRNRAKIMAAIALARIYLDFEGRGGFGRYIWSFVDGRPIQGERQRMNDIPAQNDISIAMSKDLRERGANFVGPTIIYAFMQATGMINDHLTGCYRCAECAALA
jgi:DNA-3-methyladenine glycosylase I